MSQTEIRSASVSNFVSFPAVGSPVRPAFLDRPHDFGISVASSGPPHWLYHIAVTAASSNDSELDIPSRDWMALLVESLGLSGCFSIASREYRPGDLKNPQR